MKYFESSGKVSETKVNLQSIFSRGNKHDSKYHILKKKRRYTIGKKTN